MRIPSRGSIRAMLEPVHTNSPAWGSVFVVGEMSHVYNLLDVALKGKDGLETRSAIKRKAWHGCRRKKKGEEIPQK